MDVDVIMVDCNNSSNLSFVSNSSGYYYMYLTRIINQIANEITFIGILLLTWVDRTEYGNFGLILLCLYIYILLFLGLHLIWQIFFEVEPLKAYFVAQFYLRAF